MNKITTFLSSIFAILGFGIALNAQCPGGQANVTVEVTTDQWGYECYWEYTPQTNACGTGTLGTYGNVAEVGCAGGGAQVATAGGYPNNSTTTEVLGCLTIGSCFDLHYVDDWGDGGATFEVFVDGVSMYTFVGAGAGGVFTFCVDVPPAADAAVSDVMMYEYTMIPLAHASAIPLEAEVTNAGTGDITNVVVDAEVFHDAASVYTESSTPIATMASAASQTVTFADYTPMAQGMYTFVFTASMTETDNNSANDIASYMVDVTDSIMARDNGVATGTLGIGVGTPSNGLLGQTFTPGVNDNITSATGVFGDAAIAAFPPAGEETSFLIYSMVGGVPTALLGQTAAYEFTAADAANGVTLTLPFATPVAVTAGTEFLLCVAEESNNVTLATTPVVFTPGTNWVRWDGNPTWTNAETFGFNVQYLLRANFGESAVVSIAEQAFNVGAYPNPTTDVLTLDVPAELVGEQYNVLDQTGRLVAQGTLNEVSTKVNMTSFDQGMYIVKIDAGNVTLNVIKQ